MTTVPPPPPPPPPVLTAVPRPPGFWWRVLSPVGAVILAFVILIVVAVGLFAVLSEDAAGTVAVAVGGAGILLFGALLLRRLPAHERRVALARKHSVVGAILMGVNVGLGMVIASGAIILLGTLVDPGLRERLEEEPVEIGPGVWGAVVTVIALVVLAPLGEELMFRALLLRGLVRRMTFRRAAVVSSLIFGAVHLDAWLTLNWARGVSLVVVGLGLAWLYRWRGYWGAVVAHATVNGVAAIALIAQS